MQEVIVPKRISRAYRSALASLRVLVDEIPDGDRGRLPPLAELSRHCGVAKETVRRALRTLQSQGLVSVVPGGGVFVREREAPVPPLTSLVGLPDTSRRRWEVLRERFSADILCGVYAPGQPLPSYKELSRRYGTCHATLRKALTSLAADNRIERHGRGFRVVRTGPSSSSASIVLVAITYNMSLLTEFTPRSNEFWRVLERECQRLGVTLNVHGLYESLGKELRIDGVKRTVPAVEQRGRNLGYVVWGVGPTQEQLEQLLTDMHRAQRPVAILDESGGLRVPALARRTNLVRQYSVGPGRLPGRLVGEHLIGLGHRHVAYFAASDQEHAVDTRLDGLQEAFTRAGMPDAVRVCVPDALRGMGGRTLTRLMQNAEDMEDILESSSSYTEALAAHADRHATVLVDYAVGQAISRENLRRFLYDTFEPLFDTVRGDETLTAWVTFSDSLGLLAHSYLLSHGVALPRRLSLVSFDDTIESFGAGLTSYNFNMGQVVHNMLDHILNYSPTRRQRPSPVEIPGTIMQRSSSGSARDRP